ncbi:MAG: response regulator [Deltaproteobacteria bacterium]|nr:response regulator [Deltaproteobacteria bacterium]
MGASKIMIVDDETGIRELLSEALLEKGFHVTSARDGRESLKYMRSNDFDLLITDINMPHINGFELLRKMKTAGRKEKIVIMTGEYLDLSDTAKDMPFIYFQLRKPFKLDEFLQVVSSVLKSNRRNRRSRTIKKTGKRDVKCSLN